MKLLSLVFSLLLAPVVVSAGELRLIMVEEEGCYWCERWTSEIGPIYPKTAEGRAAPLLRADISLGAPDGFQFNSVPFYTPTFILTEDGQEIGRIEGYPGEDFFWGLLEMLFKNASAEALEKMKS